jgi:hypothetical protein
VVETLRACQGQVKLSPAEPLILLDFRRDTGPGTALADIPSKPNGCMCGDQIMTDQTMHDTNFRPGRPAAESLTTPPMIGFFDRREPGFLAMVRDDFRAVPVEAWVILATSAVLSNLFIALA